MTQRVMEGRCVRALRRKRRRSTRGLRTGSCALVAALFAAPGPIRAQAEAEPDWIPALTIGIALANQRGEGTLTNSVRRAGTGILDPGDDCPTPVTGCAIDGSESIRAGVLNFGAQLTGPVLGNDWPGRPRPFVHAGYQYWTAPSTKILKEANPDDPFAPPAITSSNLLQRLEPEDWKGQGEVVGYEVEDAWWAGLGVAFTVPVPLLDRDIEVKPSFDYYGQTATVSGLVKHVEATPSPLPTVRNGQFDLITIAALQGTTLHAVGPRLALETELYRRGSVALSMYVDAMFYWFLNDRTVRFSSQAARVRVVDNDGTQLTDGGQFIDPNAFMNVDFSQEQVLAQGGIGFRVSWLGF